ncbi:MAG: hypothetical protein M1274_00155 [Actinobacteria bacterium]|nr:hypothetical protein [Actinomycetota bacterium]
MSAALRYSELADLAQKFSVSSHLYEDTFLKAMSGALTSTAFAHGLTQQLKLESGLLQATSGVLEKIRFAGGLSPDIQSLAGANSILTQLAKDIALPQSPLAGAIAAQSLFHERIKELIPGGLTATAIAKMDLSRSLSFSLAAQGVLAGMDSLAVGRLAGIDDAFRQATVVGMTHLSRSYEALIEAVRSEQLPVVHIPLAIRYPPIEYYREIAVVGSITADQGGRSTADVPVEEVGEGLPCADDLLVQFNKPLGALLDGARRSADGDNPDRVRHVATSLRELITQVLHGLAPDEQIRGWTADPAMFHKNRPTRRARLLYVVRDLDSDQLADFVERDVNAALSFVDFLSAGTHVADSRLTTTQIKSVVARAESLLVFLLQLGNSRS